MAEFAELVAVGVGAGMPPGEAARLSLDILDDVGQHPPWDGLRGRVEDAAASGASVGAVLASTAGDNRSGSAEMAFLARAWQLSERLGASVRPAAEHAAQVVRARAETRARRGALLAGPRASMLLLTLLPLVGPVGAVLLGATLRDMYGGALPVGLLVTGLILTLAGWLTARELLRRAVRPTALDRTGGSS